MRRSKNTSFPQRGVRRVEAECLIQSNRPQVKEGFAHFRNGRRLITARLSQTSPGSLLGRLLRLPLRLVPKRAVVTVRSGLNKGLHWIAGSSVHGCWLGHYEQEKQALATRLVQPGMKVLDIGANAGFYTLAFSHLVGKSGHVWAFEPIAANACKLSNHLALNEITNVTLIQAGVASGAGIAAFDTDFGDSEWRMSNRPGTYLIPTVSLDALVETGILPVPDFIKMDVEGAEASVLAGAKGILENGKTSFMIALHANEQLNQCLSQLLECRYRIYRLDGMQLESGCGFADEIYALPPA